MKKITALVLVLAMTVVFAAGCGSKAGNGENLTQPVDAIVDEIIEKNPVEFAGEKRPIDLTDDSEEGKWMIQSMTGLEDVSNIREAVAYEPSMGSMAFSMVLVRVNDSKDAKAVAEKMKAGIDPRKWVCVEANDIKAAGYGDVVMFIMLDNTLDMEAQTFIDAFGEICGADFDFTL